MFTHIIIFFCHHLVIFILLNFSPFLSLYPCFLQNTDVVHFSKAVNTDIGGQILTMGQHYLSVTKGPEVSNYFINNSLNCEYRTIGHTQGKVSQLCIAVRLLI